MMVFDFSGKNALVTGAGSGIGKAVALQFADAGANVWIGDISGEKAADSVSEMDKYGNSYGFTRLDVSKKDEAAAMFADALRVLGRIDIVVNSAGVFMKKHLLDASPEEINRHIGINLMGAVYGCQLALETMIRQGEGGKIVNIASVGGRRGELDFPYYSLGKAGVLNWTQSVAYNGAPHGINCNAVCPGIIRTPMWDDILDAAAREDVSRDELFDEILKARTPLGRSQTGEEMAYATLFLSSGYADAIVGQALNVCGGSVMS